MFDELLDKLDAELDTRDEEIKLDLLDALDERFADLTDELELIATDVELTAIKDEKLEGELAELGEFVVVELLELVADCCELTEGETDRELDEGTGVLA